MKYEWNRSKKEFTIDVLVIYSLNNNELYYDINY